MTLVLHFTFPLDKWEGRLVTLIHVRNPPFINTNYYHIYNRGVEKRLIFYDRWDCLRFIETLDYYRMSPLAMKLSDFRRSKFRLRNPGQQEEIVRIFCYSLMPNHFHLLVQQQKDNGITIFIRKVLDSYTRHFNLKHDRIGPLFQGSFRARLIETDKYLLHLSRYIHKNIFPLNKWERRNYAYSTYGNYISGRKHSFCDTNFILAYFSQNNPYLDYRSFVESKDDDNPNIFNLLIDPDN